MHVLGRSFFFAWSAKLANT